MVADAMVGLFLAGTLLTIVALVTGGNRRAELATQQHHALLTHAELTLLALQCGEAANLPEDETIIVEVEVLEPPQADAAPRDQWVWAQVTARKDSAKAELIGKVPSQALDQEDGNGQ